MKYARHTLKAGRGTYAGSMLEVCEWQAKHQGSSPTIDGVDVSDIDFDADQLDECVFRVGEAMRGNAWWRDPDAHTVDCAGLPPAPNTLLRTRHAGGDEGQR